MTYESSSYGALALGLVCHRLDPYFATTILAIVAVSLAFKAAMTRDELEREAVRENRLPIFAASLGALLVGLHILDISFGLPPY